MDRSKTIDEHKATAEEIRSAKMWSKTTEARDAFNADYRTREKEHEAKLNEAQTSSERLQKEYDEAIANCDEKKADTILPQLFAATTRAKALSKIIVAPDLGKLQAVIDAWKIEREETSKHRRALYDLSEEFEEISKEYSNIANGLEIAARCCNTSSMDSSIIEQWEFFNGSVPGVPGHEKNLKIRYITEL